jgi:hypothetical protein
MFVVLKGGISWFYRADEFLIWVYLQVGIAPPCGTAAHGVRRRVGRLLTPPLRRGWLLRPLTGGGGGSSKVRALYYPSKMVSSNMFSNLNGTVLYSRTNLVGA